MNFCSAKQRTLQSFVMKKSGHCKFLQSEKADTTEFEGDTIQLCIEHYKIV